MKAWKIAACVAGGALAAAGVIAAVACTQKKKKTRHQYATILNKSARYGHYYIIVEHNGSVYDIEVREDTFNELTKGARIDVQDYLADEYLDSLAYEEDDCLCNCLGDCDCDDLLDDIPYDLGTAEA